jgi:hypothetical protein
MISHIAPTALVICICSLIVHLPFFVWRSVLKNRSGPRLIAYSSFSLALVIGLGLIGFVAGFFGPIEHSSSSQGPLLGIFITGPLGAITGVLVAWIWFYARRNARNI